MSTLTVKELINHLLTLKALDLPLVLTWEGRHMNITLESIEVTNLPKTLYGLDEHKVVLIDCEHQGGFAP